MIVGQRCVVTVARGHEAAGNVVAYVLAVDSQAGALSTAGRVVVQTDAGGFLFAEPATVRVIVPDQLERQAERDAQLSAQPDVRGHRPHVRELQNAQDRRRTPDSGPKCPTHRLAVPSKRVAGGFYCPAPAGEGFCNWTYAPEEALSKAR